MELLNIKEVGKVDINLNLNELNIIIGGLLQIKEYYKGILPKGTSLEVYDRLIDRLSWTYDLVSKWEEK